MATKESFKQSRKGRKGGADNSDRSSFWSWLSWSDNAAPSVKSPEPVSELKTNAPQPVEANCDNWMLLLGQAQQANAILLKKIERVANDMKANIASLNLEGDDNKGSIAQNLTQECEILMKQINIFKEKLEGDVVRLGGGTGKRRYKMKPIKV